MCIVIDTNTLASVFERKSQNHQEFEPVLNWIYDGKGKIVYGGTKYLSELGYKYVAVFGQLRKAQKAKVVDSASVDRRAEAVASTVIHEDFDDQHLVALLIESGCKLICSLDSRAYPFFTHPTFFKPAKKRPKIYSSSSNEDLLDDQNIAEICRPCKPTTKMQKAALTLIQP